MDSSQDLYAILGVSPGASEEEIRQAHRLAVLRFHPDRNKAPGAVALFKDIQAAYEILSERQSRAEYDRDRSAFREMPSGLLLETVHSRQQVRLLDEPQLLYTLVKLRPTLEVGIGNANAPLNLCLVVDRSKSMSGPRLKQLKDAANRIIDEASDDDLISVVLPPQHPYDRRTMKAMLSTIRADGATAILAGLSRGLGLIEQNKAQRYVNHLVLITDGRTYGDEDGCLALAAEAHAKGIGISGMGIGEDWNDRFLDALASRTGGASAYIASPDTVSRFLRNRIRSLATAFAERARLIVSPVGNTALNAVTRVSPDPMALPLTPQPIPLGTIDSQATTSILLQFHIDTKDAEAGKLFVGRVDVSADILGLASHTERIMSDLIVTVTDEEIAEEPPPDLIDALHKLTLYRLQERAREALEDGDVVEATRKLEYLATRLFEVGEDELGQAALREARRVAHTHQFSEEGVKHLKYGTRALLPLGDEDDDQVPILPA